MKIIDFDNPGEIWNYIKLTVSNQIKFSLKEYGVTKEDIDFIVSKSINKDRMGNNIIELNNDDIRKILLKTGDF